VAALVSLALACTPPGLPAAPAPTLLYVANALDNTISLLDSQSGRPIGPPLPAGHGPGRIAPGPAGSLLHLSVGATDTGQVTWVGRTGAAGPWSTRPLDLGEPAVLAFLAADGARYAAVAYLTGEGDARRCRLALVDATAGAVMRTHTVCGPQEWISGLALSQGDDPPIAYLGLWRGVRQPNGAWETSSFRVAAIDAQSGAIRTIVRLAAPPLHLTLARAPHGGARLYAFEGTDRLDDDDVYSATRGRLLALDAATLEPLQEYALPDAPWRVVVSPDSTTAYTLAAGGRAIRGVDLATGATRWLSDLPAAGADLAVAQRAIYVANPKGSELWLIDRRTGRLSRTIPAGRHPAALALAGQP
jgi:hypothetical protein